MHVVLWLIRGEYINFDLDNKEEHEVFLILYNHLIIHK